MPSLGGFEGTADDDRARGEGMAVVNGSNAMQQRMEITDMTNAPPGYLQDLGAKVKPMKKNSWRTSQRQQLHPTIPLMKVGNLMSVL